MKNFRNTGGFSINTKGYMLVEALIAIAIFAVGFLAVATLVFSASQNNRNGNILTQANMLARQTLEQLKNTPDITTLPSDLTAFDDPSNPIDAFGNPGGRYTRSWTIEDTIGFNTSREIHVVVSWKWRGRDRRVVLSNITKGKGI